MNRTANVLLMGDPKLRKVSSRVTKSDLKDSVFKSEIKKLQSTLLKFRKQHSFGRAIAAPQIGLLKRAVAFNLNGKEFVMYNPKIVWESEEKKVMYDDCMSLPDLKIKLERNKSISVDYLDEKFEKVQLKKLGWEESELMQHEFDHLDGVLCVDRVLKGKNSIIYKEMFEKHFKNAFYG